MLNNRAEVGDTNINCAHLFDGHGCYRLGLICFSQQCSEIRVPTGASILHRVHRHANEILTQECQGPWLLTSDYDYRILGRTAWVHIPAPSLTSCEILGKLLNFSVF